MIAKQEVINVLRSMPDDVSYSDIMDTVEIIHANRNAMKDIIAGKTHSTEEAKRLIREKAKSDANS